ncbi:hypothetical protein RhiirC2_853123 [Rhizophagus irregularis]|uniref:Uncharacterized protein n=1 Tax=Rhizophagus irregularis TaxID=588596 RepID=A0A2N1MWZ4_9GLOM|nr:hypothetical protein RhiirC2_853123 [Rhizophagus irregularis]
MLIVGENTYENAFPVDIDTNKEHLKDRPIETKEVHCTAVYERKSVNFQWTVTREMMMLEDFKKKLCEYFTFPDGTENVHIVVDRVIGGSGFQQSATVKSDTVETATERKVIQFSADEDLLRYVKRIKGIIEWFFAKLKEKDFFYASNEEIGNAIERSLKFEGLEEAWIISQKKKSFNNNSLEKIQLIFELPSNNVSLNEEVLKDKAKD